jgi:hypothetical protein
MNGAHRAAKSGRQIVGTAASPRRMVVISASKLSMVRSQSSHHTATFLGRVGQAAGLCSHRSCAALELWRARLFQPLTYVSYAPVAGLSASHEGATNKPQQKAHHRAAGEPHPWFLQARIAERFHQQPHCVVRGSVRREFREQARPPGTRLEERRFARRAQERIARWGPGAAAIERQAVRGAD